MATIPPSRNIIDQEETRANRAVSEATQTRQAAMNNFNAFRLVVPYVYEYAGPFRPLFGGEGGTLTVINDSTIVGLSGSLRNSGTSGSSDFDCHLVRNGVDQGSILSTRLQIADDSTANAYWWVNAIDESDDTINWASPSNSGASSTVTLPVFSTFDINAGDQLRIDCDDNAFSAQDLIINLWIRPR